MSNNPFKFLDSFQQGDPYFFGRDEEVKQLKKIVTMHRLTLVYGASGVGKTSLIRCGLSRKFDASDWHPIFVQRKGNIKASIYKALEGRQEEEIAEVIIRYQEDVRRPMYLIVDQLEEIYINGDQKEQDEFADLVVAIISKGLPCQLILICREKYIGRLAKLEDKVHLNYSQRFRIAPMTWKSVKDEVLRKTFRDAKITVPNSEKVYEKIGKNLIAPYGGEEEIVSPGDYTEIDLPFLQVYLDRLWTEKIAHEPDNAKDVTGKEVDELGTIVGILRDHIDKAKKDIVTDLSLSKKFVHSILEWLVTKEKTKKGQTFKLKQNVAVFDAPAQEWKMEDHQKVYKALQKLKVSRLVRIEKGYVELRHDVLAKIISEKTPEELHSALLIKDFDIRYRLYKNIDLESREELLLTRVEVGRFLELRNSQQLKEGEQKYYDDSKKKWESREKRMAIEAKNLLISRTIRYVAIFLFIAVAALAYATYQSSKAKKAETKALTDVKAARDSLARYVKVVEGDLNIANKILDRPYFVQNVKLEISKLELYKAKRSFLAEDLILTDTSILSTSIVDLAKELVFVFVNIKDYKSAREIIDKFEQPNDPHGFKRDSIPQSSTQEVSERKDYLKLLFANNTKLKKKLEDKYYPKMQQVEGGEFSMGVDTALLEKIMVSYQGWYDAQNASVKKDTNNLPRKIRQQHLADKPLHNVTLSPYCLSEVEVTLYQYQLMMLRNKDTTAFQEYRDRAFMDREMFRGDLPVVRVSWEEAATYTNWLSEFHGYQPFYDQLESTKDKIRPNSVPLKSKPKSYRLMTVAEYENAVKGPKPWKLYGKSDNADSSAVLNVPDALYPVKGRSKLPTRDTIYDLVGNVWEWAHDFEDSYFKDGDVDPGDPVNEKTVNYKNHMAVGDAKPGEIGKQHFMAQLKSSKTITIKFRTIRVARYCD